MPEGPEVRRCADQLSQYVLGGRTRGPEGVSGKISRQPSMLLDDPQLIEKIYTKGKSIFIDLENDHTIISTLGMSGWWFPDPSIVRELESKAYVTRCMDYSRAKIACEDGRVAYYVDMRNFGNLKLVSRDEAASHADKLGLDLLTLKEEDLGVAKDRLRKQNKRKIGEALLSQGVLAGLGNIYRAETLYLCRTSPHALVKDLSDVELITLIWAAHKILTLAYIQEGQMNYPLEFIREYFGDTEQVRPGTLVYGRSKGHLGHVVTPETVGGRTMWWAPDACEALPAASTSL